jgi:hypothetical protein
VSDTLQFSVVNTTIDGIKIGPLLKPPLVVGIKDIVFIPLYVKVNGQPDLEKIEEYALAY